MIYKTILLTSLACAFQSNVQASHLEPIIDFIQRHDEISIEYRCNPDIGEEIIELTGVGQTFGAYKRNGEIFMGMSGPNGQENMWVITEDVTEIWVFLKHVVDVLILADYQMDKTLAMQTICITITPPIESLRALAMAND